MSEDQREGRVYDSEFLRSNLWKTFSTGDVSGRGSLREQLLAIGGASERTKSGVDVRAAAAKIGRSEGVVRGWLNRGGHPSAASIRTVRTIARRTGRTKAGRAAAVQRARQSGALRGVTRISITAVQGPVRGGSGYARERTINLANLSEDQLDQFAQVYAEQGERAAMKWIEGAVERDYMDGWALDSWDADGAGIAFS